MSTLRTTAFGSIAALWLTLSACTTMDNENRADFPLGDANTTEYLHVQPDETVAESDEGCQSDLVETLANRDVYELLSAGYDFKNVREGTEAETTLSERIKIYKEERTEQLSIFFDCQDQNTKLHSLASDISANPDDPTNPDKFRALLVNVASERMDDVHSLYSIDMIQDAAQEWKDFVVSSNRSVLKNLDGFFKDDVLEERIGKLIEDNYDRLALGIARFEMADFLNVDGKVEGTSVISFARDFQLLVTKEVSDYVKELEKIKQTRGPQLEV